MNTKRESLNINISLKNYADINNTSFMFYQSISLLKFPDISVLNSSNIESMISIFNHSEQLNLIGDISK